MSSEPRKGQRKHVSLLLRLKHPDVDRFVEEFATNVSDSGMFVRTRSPAAAGTNVAFEVRLAQDQLVLKGTALVRWARLPDDPAGPPGMGLEFTALEEGTRTLIERMVGHKSTVATFQGTPPLDAMPGVAPIAPPSMAPLTPAIAPIVSPVTPTPPIPPVAVAKIAPVKAPAPPAAVIAPPPAAPSAIEDEPLFPTESVADAVAPPPAPADHVDLDLSNDLLSEILASAPSTAPAAPPADDVLDPFLDFHPLPGETTQQAAPPPPAPTPEPKSSGGTPIRVPGASNEFEFTDGGDDIPLSLANEPAAPPPPAAPVARAPAPIAPSGPPRVVPTAPPAAPARPSLSPVQPTQRTSASARTVYLKEIPAPKSEGPVIGIDLGTTNSCVAVLLNNKPTVLRTREGHSTLPSVISVNQQGKLLIGHRAKGQQLLNPNNTIYGAKRLVGRPYESAVVREVLSRFLYDICADEKGRAAVRVGGQVVSLEEVQGIILREAKELAESHLNRTVHRAVVTVPAYYSEPQREAVRRAGELAGLEITRILNEPTSAALAYGLNRQLQRRVLVYDLGGGTFDATLLKVENNVFEVLATAGDTFLGGVDFDNGMVDLLLERFQDAEKIPFSGDRVALSRIADAAERAKIALSERSETLVDVPMLMMDDAGTPRNLRTTITRSELEKVVSPLIDRTLEVLRDVLLDAKLKPNQVDDIILVGGQSRMPLVRAKLQDFFKKAPHAGVNADEAVALGAALLAGTVDKASSVVLIDVLPVTIGFGRPGGKFERLLNRNSPLPASATFELTNTETNQMSLEVFIFQGENRHVSGNEYLGTATVIGISPGKKGSVKTKLTVRLSPECRLSIEATDANGRPLKTKLEMQYTLEELQKRLEVSSEAASAAEAQTTGELRSRAGRFWSKLTSAFRK